MFTAGFLLLCYRSWKTQRVEWSVTVDDVTDEDAQPVPAAAAVVASLI